MIRKIVLWFKNLVFWAKMRIAGMKKEAVDSHREEHVRRDYASMKDSWVTYKDRKGKVKLRSVIRDAATKLSKYTDENYNACRDKLIESYEVGGLDEVAKTVQRELELIVKKMDEEDKAKIKNVRKQSKKR